MAPPKSDFGHTKTCENPISYIPSGLGRDGDADAGDNAHKNSPQELRPSPSHPWMKYLVQGGPHFYIQADFFVESLNYAVVMTIASSAQVPPPRRGIHVVVFFLSLGGFPLGYEGPVLCLLKRLTKRKKYRAECPRFFVFEFGSKSEYPYSAKIPPNFGSFSRRCSVYFGGNTPLKVHFVAILAQLGSIWDAKRLPNAIYR